MSEFIVNVYDEQRKNKEIIKILLSIFLVVIGLVISVFNHEFGLELAMTIVGLLGIAQWLLDGKKYVFPPRFY